MSWKGIDPSHADLQHLANDHSTTRDTKMSYIYIAQRTLTKEWRESFRVDIELYQHGS